MRELEDEIDKRRIRAPIAGRLGDVAALTVGAFVRVGDELSMIIPKGALRIVAQFAPDEALGRIQRGQSGELRLFAFPWTQYGSVSGVVERVAQEVRDGRVRVELLIPEPRAARVPLQHGLPGSLQIAVDATSPASLAWRAAGRGFMKRPAGGP
jgi:multidrug efflux pump subunit AcrA (membrane-fusion protein)